MHWLALKAAINVTGIYLHPSLDKRIIYLTVLPKFITIYLLNSREFDNTLILIETFTWRFDAMQFATRWDNYYSTCVELY